MTVWPDYIELIIKSEQTYVKNRLYHWLLQIVDEFNLLPDVSSLYPPRKPLRITCWMFQSDRRPYVMVAWFLNFVCIVPPKPSDNFGSINR